MHVSDPTSIYLSCYYFSALTLLPFLSVTFSQLIAGGLEAEEPTGIIMSMDDLRTR